MSDTVGHSRSSEASTWPLSGKSVAFSHPHQRTLRVAVTRNSATVHRQPLKSPLLPRNLAP